VRRPVVYYMYNELSSGTDLFSDDLFQLLGFLFLPPPFDEFVRHFAVLVPAGVGGPVHLGLDGAPLFAVRLHQIGQDNALLLGPRPALERVQLADPVPVHRLDGPVRQPLRDFHPRPLQVGLVVALAAQARRRNLSRRAVLLDGLANQLALLSRELPALLPHRRAVPVLVPLVAGVPDVRADVHATPSVVASAGASSASTSFVVVVVLMMLMVNVGRSTIVVMVVRSRTRRRRFFGRCRHRLFSLLITGI